MTLGCIHSYKVMLTGSVFSLLHVIEIHQDPSMFDQNSSSAPIMSQTFTSFKSSHQINGRRCSPWKDSLQSTYKTDQAKMSSEDKFLSPAEINTLKSVSNTHIWYSSTQSHHPHSKWSHKTCSTWIHSRPFITWDQNTSLPLKVHLCP